MSTSKPTRSLFRSEAVYAQRARLEGELLLVRPLSSYAVTGLIAAIVVAAVCFLASGRYARKESVRGLLVPDRGLISVASPLPAIVVQQHVHEGAQVKRGTVLLTLSSERATVDGTSVHAELLLDLARQEQLLNQERERVQEQFALEQTRLREQQVALGQELSALRRLKRLQRQRMSVFEAGLKSVEHLRQGASSVVSEDEVRSRKAAYLTEGQGVEETLRSAAGRRREYAQLESDLHALPLRHETELARIEGKLSEISARRAEVQNARAFSVTAPVDGRVTAIQAWAGRSVQMHSVLCAILPEGGQLEAEVYIPTRAAGFVRKGQHVRLYYDAFPYEHYGAYQGFVRELSATILSPDELATPLGLKEPVYRARLQIDAQQIAALGARYPLRSGMLVTAHIVLERRSLLDWILKPLYALRGKS